MMPLWEHQRQAIERARELNDLALFHQIGTGKSRTMIEILREDFNESRSICNTLIFCPVSVCNQWKAEILKFSKIPESRILVLTQNGKIREQLLRSHFGSGTIVITNYEATTINKFLMTLYEWKPEIVIYDESQRCKDATTARVKKLVPLSKKARRRFILTGTPVLNSPLDLFGQYLLLDCGKTFGENFYSFRSRYAYDKNAGMPSYKHFPLWVVREDSEEKFSQIIAQTAVQADKDECLDLPPLLKVDIPVELNDAQRVSYESMKRTFVAEVAGTQMAAEFAMTKTLRMQQIIAGFGVNDSDPAEKPKPVYFGDNPRLETLKGLLETLGEERVIIWTIWQPTYMQIERVATLLKRKVAFLTGEQTTWQKQQSINDFRSGAINTLVAHPAAGGTGINLTEAKYSIYFTKSYSLEQYLQSEGRNYRGGSEQHEKITHYHITAKDTLDEVVHAALMNKQRVADKILEWAEKDRLTYHGTQYIDTSKETDICQM